MRKTNDIAEQSDRVCNGFLQTSTSEREPGDVPAHPVEGAERDARPAATDTPPADPIDVSRVTKAGLRPIRNHPAVGRDEHGVIRSLDPDRFDAATRAAVDAFVESLSNEAGRGERVSGRTDSTIKSAGRAYGMVLRLSAAVERAGAVAPNGRIRSVVKALGEWEDRLAALLKLLPEPTRAPVDPREALRRAVEEAKARR